MDDCVSCAADSQVIMSTGTSDVIYKRQYLLVVLISIVATFTVAGEFCSADKICSGFHMMGSSQSPLWEILDANVGRIQLYYNVSEQSNENSSHHNNEDWNLELHQLFQMDSEILTKSSIQNCSIAYSGNENSTSLINGMSTWCKLKTKFTNVDRETIFFSENCHECKIKSKVHSAVNFMKCPPNSSEEAKWAFNYVYSGWYALLVNKNIVSAPFWLETNFTKQNEMNLTVLPKEKKKRSVEIMVRGEALKNDCGHPMINASCINVKINKFNLKFRIYYNKKEGDKPRYCIKRGNETLVNITYASWNNNELIFELQIMDSLPSDNFQVSIQVLDSKCRRDRVWIWNKTDGEICLWKVSPFSLSYDEMRSHVGLQDISKAAETQVVSRLRLVIAMVAAIIASILSVLGYKYWKHPPRGVYIDTDRPIPLDPTPMKTGALPSYSILLLYARDCDPFMETMVVLRQLLQRITKLPVVDIWDDNMRKEWDNNGAKLALNIINSENTQVLIVATPISRIIEKLILSEAPSTIEMLYKVPNSLDEIFVVALESSMRWMDAHPVRCRKFIVTRLETMGCSENLFTSFKTLCTVYTLPTLLNGVFQHILDDKWDQRNLKQEDRDLLETKVKELDKHLLTNKRRCCLVNGNTINLPNNTLLNFMDTPR